MRKMLLIIAAIMVTLSLAACAGGKAPAEQAIKAAEEALNAAKAEAMKYVPDQVKAVEDALNAAKQSFANKDYAGATSAATNVTAKVKELVSAAAAKKTEMTNQWNEFSGGLPKMIDAIKSRVDILSKSKKLPPNLDKAKFEGAQNGLSEITKVWDDANNAFKTGNLADALAKAKTVKERAAEIMATLGMEVPLAAQK